MKKKFFILFLFFLLFSCGKVGPLSLPEEKLNKSIITYPCDDACMKNLMKKKNVSNQ